MDYPNQDDPCVAACYSDPQALADDRRPADVPVNSKPGRMPEEAPERKGGWRAFFRILFGLNAAALGIIMMLEPLGDPLTVEDVLTIGVSLVYLFIGWLFIAGRQSKYFKTPF